MATIRERLITYLTNADERKVKAIYTLLTDDIEYQDPILLTDEQYDILIQERERHLAGETASYSKEEAIALIRGQK